MKNSKMLAVLLALVVLNTSAFGQQWDGAQNTTGDIFRTGNVGIGTTAPTEKLTVEGNIAARRSWREPGPGDPPPVPNKWEGNAVSGEMEWYRHGIPPFEPLRVTLALSYGHLGGLEIDRTSPFLPGRAVGVYGVATGGGFAMRGYGGYFVGEGRGDYGVYGRATDANDTRNYGGYFVADGQRGVGIYAKGGPAGNAAEFDGKLEVNSGSDMIACRLTTTTVFSGIAFNNSDVDTDAIFVGAQSSDLRLVTGGSDAVAIKSNGNVGIGTLTPGSHKLVVNGSAAKPGGGSWSSYSDERLKTLDATYERGLSEVSKLSPIRYSYREDNNLGLPAGRKHVGLVAQEVRSVIPEAVEQNNGGYLMVNNDPIIWAMVNAIKQLNTQNQELITENTKLVQRLDALESLVKRQDSSTIEKVNRQ